MREEYLSEQAAFDRQRKLKDKGIESHIRYAYKFSEQTTVYAVIWEEGKEGGDRDDKEGSCNQ